MSAFGPTAAQSIAGTLQAEKAQESHNARAERARRVKDADKSKGTLEAEADKVEIVSAVRDLKGNADEQTHEDRAAKQSPADLKNKKNAQLDVEA